jgi:hypothetical protein
MTDTTTAQEFRDAAARLRDIATSNSFLLDPSHAEDLSRLLLVAAEQRDHLDRARAFAHASNEAMVSALQARDAAESRQLERGAKITTLTGQLEEARASLATIRASAKTLLKRFGFSSIEDFLAQSERGEP